jgi:Spy/CpxP family protein refolding chaperone
MKRSLNKAMIGAVASGIATLFITTFTWSTPHVENQDHSPEKLLTHMTKILDLTEEQQAVIEPLLVSTFEEAKVDGARLDVLRKTLHDQRDVFDEVTAHAAADEIGQLTGRLVYRMASAQAAVYKLLDEEQKVAMNKMEEWRQEHHRQGRGRHRLPSRSLRKCHCTLTD